MVVRFLSVSMREGCDVCHRLAENISGVPAATLLMTVREKDKCACKFQGPELFRYVFPPHQVSTTLGYLSIVTKMGACKIMLTTGFGSSGVPGHAT